MLERSKLSRPLNDSKDGGMTPLKKFLLTARNSSFTQLPRLVGISPNNKFLEISKYSRFFKFLISMGRTPINLLPNKSTATGENEKVLI